MRIAIVGAGAIGGVLGAALAHAGHDVSLIARGAHLESLAEHGLRIRWLGQPERRHRLRALADPTALGAQDIVIITLKAYSIRAVLPRLGSMIGPETMIVPAINGLPWWYFYRLGGERDGRRIACLDPDGAMGAMVPAESIVGCVVHAAAEVVSAGVVDFTYGKVFYLGELDGATTPRLRALEQALAAGGLEPRLTGRIRNEIWMKLIGNLSYNPIAALTLARMAEINASEGLVRLIRALMAEAMAVATAYGEPITMSIDERIALARSLGNAKVSMHQDLERGRPLEVAAITGAVVELGREANVPVPTIEAVHALIAERARQAQGG